MLIKSLGHAKFLLETEAGARIVTDPFDASTGYPITPVKADLALVSHHHHDHDAVDTLDGQPQVIDTAGVSEPLPGVRVTAVEACHDDQGGALRGKTLLFLIEAEGLRIVHLGDLGHLLTPDQVKTLQSPDVLLVPVGGHFTIDAPTALKVCEQLHPRTVVPMHYRTEYNAGWPIQPLSAFLDLYPARAETLQLLRVTEADVACQPKLAVLERTDG